MDVYEIVDRNEKAAVSALRHRNEALLDLVKPYFTMSERFLDARTELPLVGRLPTPRETAAQWFGFFGEVLKEDRELLLSVVKLLPEHTVDLPASKPAAKAA